MRATRLHGELDDSVMLVDALEPDFYAKRGFDKSVDANIIAAEIRQWLTNEGTPKELRTLTLLSAGNHVPKMIRRWAWQRVPDPAAGRQPRSTSRARGDDETPPVLGKDDLAGEATAEAGEGFANVAARCGVDVHALLSANPRMTATMDRRRVMARRLKQVCGRSMAVARPQHARSMPAACPQHARSTLTGCIFYCAPPSSRARRCGCPRRASPPSSSTLSGSCATRATSGVTCGSGASRSTDHSHPQHARCAQLHSPWLHLLCQSARVLGRAAPLDLVVRSAGRLR